MTVYFPAQVSLPVFALWLMQRNTKEPSRHGNMTWVIQCGTEEARVQGGLQSFQTTQSRARHSKLLKTY